MPKGVGIILVLLFSGVSISYAETPGHPSSAPSSRDTMPQNPQEEMQKHTEQFLEKKNSLFGGDFQSDFEEQVRKQTIVYTQDNDAFIRSITFADGFTVTIHYGFNSKGEVSQITFSHGNITLTISEEDTQEHLYEEPYRQLPVLSGNTQNQGNMNPSVSAFTTSNESHDVGEEEPALIAISVDGTAAETNAVFNLKIKQTAEEFSSLLSALKSKHALSGQSPASGQFDFAGLKQLFKSFDKSQKMAFQTYLQESSLYYLEMKAKLATDEDKENHKKSENVNRPETRKKIDHRVEEIIQNASQESFRTDMRASQMMLFRQYIEPSQAKLKQALDENFSEFGKKIELLIPGKTMIQIDGDITEILIYLSLPS